MKKILCLYAVLLSHNLLANNFVPVFNCSNEENRGKVYEIVNKYSFLRLLDSANLEGLTQVQQKDAIKDAIDNNMSFISKKCQENCHGVIVSFIPKSLYQLFAFNHRQDAEINESLSFCPEPSSAKNVYNIFEYCMKYSGRSDVISVFWKINDAIWSDLSTINEFVEATKQRETVVISESMLQKSIDIAIKQFDNAEQSDFQENFQKIFKIFERHNVQPNVQPSLNALFDLEEKLRFVVAKSIDYDFKRRLLGIIDLIVRAKTRFANVNIHDMITRLIKEEANAPKNTYRIYRSCRKGCLYNFKAILDKEDDQFSYSFSDGFFAGLSFDSGTGSAFGIILNDRSYSSYYSVDCIDIKTELMFDNNSALCFFPPALPLWSLLGKGEFHHPRTKVRANSINESLHLVNGVAEDSDSYKRASEYSCPWLFFKNKDAMHFWDLKQHGETIIADNGTYIRLYEHK